MKKLIIPAALAVLLVGCSHHDALKDAPASVNNDTANVITMPDHFPNIAWKCIGLNGVYVNTRDAGVNMVVVEGDTNCGGKVVGG